MTDAIEVTEEEIDTYYEGLKKDAAAGGYHLNPDVAFTKALCRGLLTNIKRYGYQACPCRLSSGKKEKDLDIICPCDYRDADVVQYGACYCGLYVSEPIAQGKEQAHSIPERRPPADKRKLKQAETETEQANLANLPYPVYRCKVCGYLCARDEPPEICPICKAKKERFERFL
jgi:ferredoxin-thioredoxin reductase catalytic subunit